MKSLYFLAGFVALVAAAPSPAPVPGPIDWVRNLFRGGNEQQRQARAQRLRADRATSAEVRFFSEDVPRGKAYNISLPATTVLNVQELLNPTRLQMIRGPEGSNAICYVLDQYGRIDQERFFTEDMNNAYVAPQGVPPPRVGYISCAIQEPDASEALIRFSSPGQNTPVFEDYRVAVPGAAEVTKPSLQRAQQVQMLAHPIPGTVCFIMDEIAGEAVRIGQVSVEGGRPFQSRNGQPNVRYISCLPPGEDLEYATQPQPQRTN